MTIPYIALLLATAATHGFASIQNSRPVVVDEVYTLASKPTAQISDMIGPSISYEDDQALGDLSAISPRDPVLVNFGWYSHTYDIDGFKQWVFGNATQQANISISDCVNLSDAVGIYHLSAGGNKTNATGRDIINDLGIGTSSESPERNAIRTMENALLAMEGGQAYLDSILCAGGSTRQLLDNGQYDGRVLAVVLKTTIGLALGLSAIEISTKGNATSFQLTAAGITGGGVLLLVSLIDLCRENGQLSPYAAWIGNTYIALYNRIVSIAGGAPYTTPGECITVPELQDAIEEISQTSDETLGLTAYFTPGSQATPGSPGFCEAA